MRNALLCVAGSVLLVILSSPLIRTFSLQVRMAIPRGVPSAKAVWTAFLGDLHKSPEVVTLWRAFQRVDSPLKRPDDLSVVEAIDPANGMRAWLEFLLILRGQDAIAASRPAEADPVIIPALGRLRAVPPVRLHAMQEQRLILRALADESPRQRSSYAPFFIYGAVESAQPNTSRSSRPLLSDIADRLETLAQRWQKEDRAAESRAARESIVRLMTQVVDDSPTPELAALAAEKMVPALRGLGESARADRMAEFQERWRLAFAADQTNVVPHTGKAVVAEREHDFVLRSMAAVLACLVAWTILAVLVIAFMVALLVTQPPDDITVQWRHPAQGPREAALLACAPLLAVLVVLVVTDLPWMWLISYPSAQSVILLTSLMLVSTGAASWLCVRLPEPFRACPLPARTVWAVVAFCIPTFLVVMLFVPIEQGPGFAPPMIQRFRLWGSVLGLLSLLVTAAWVVGGLVHRTRTGLPAGVWARAGLNTAASALLLTSILLWPVLIANQYLDTLHSEAFVQASTDPLADRLGPDWKERYFAIPTGATLPAGEKP